MLLFIQILTLLTVIYASPNKNDVQNILRHVEKYDQLEQKLSYDVIRQMYGPILDAGNVNSTGCKCVGFNCGCCLHMKVEQIKLDDTVCANFSYLPSPDYGISFTLTVDKTTIINETISARNPPDICVDIPELKQLASLCLQFKNLTITDKTFSGCVYITARLAKIRIESIKIGCFVIPPKNQSEHVRVTVV